jgi:hypothetical protein
MYARFTVAVLVCSMAAALFFCANARAVGDALAIVACSSGLACTGGKNAGSGPGVRGHSQSGWGVQGSSTTSYGVIGITRGTSAGVYGQGGDNGTGLYGTSQRGEGVRATSVAGYAVDGTSKNSAGVFGSGGIAGLYGTSDSGYGAYAYSRTGYALTAISKASSAIVAQSHGSVTAIGAYGGTGDAIEAFSNGGIAAYVRNTKGTGADITGSSIGAVVSAPAGASTLPFVVTDSNGNELFYVNGNGDVRYHGSIGPFSGRPNQAALEDTGSAELVNGIAVVAFAPAFARAMNPRRAYHVLLTPDGDTRGLFVARKDTRGFVVREVQGGRGSFAFDYHVYAETLDAANVQLPPVQRQVQTVRHP